jgi:coenzyme F420-reducing hydrogenase alpha subunit
MIDGNLEKEQYIVLNYRGIEESKIEKGIVQIKEILCRLY